MYQVETPVADKKIQKWNRRYRVALFCLVLAIAILTAIGVSQIFKTADTLKAQSQQITDNGEGIISYLDCVGHLPVVGREQADVDHCLDLMKMKIRGE